MPTSPSDLFDRLMVSTQGWIVFIAIGLIAVGGSIALVLMAVTSDSALRRRLTRYEAALDREIKFLLIKTTGAHIIRLQTIFFLVLLVGAFLLGHMSLIWVSPLLLTAPIVVLRRRRDKRTVALEFQLDGWLMVLSNALKAAPSLGEALATSASLTRSPMSDEIDLVLKEVRLGSPVDQALLHMANRVNSRTLWGAIATLLVSRQTGGDVSRILEESAGALREMARLEGIVKTKTADGRMQAYVLSGMPFALLAAIHFIDPTWLSVLGRSALGYLIVGAAGVLWVLGFLSARKILAVDV